MDHGRMSAPTEPRLDGRCVLVVEDQYLVADEMRRMVRSMGGDVIGPVARATAALELLANRAVDLALLDINLGDGNAYEVAKELLRREVPFLFATGCEPWVIPEQFQDVPRLDKPLTSRTLADAVHRLGL
jgi:DNA-binding NarL/FixJ family response regulator